MKKLKYTILGLFLLTGCSVSDLEQKLDISSTDKIIVLSCLGVVAFSTLIIIIISLTKINDKKKIEINDSNSTENSEDKQ